MADLKRSAKMKRFAASALIFLAGCAMRSRLVPTDYVTRLEEPVTLAGISIVLHTSFSGIQLADRFGRQALVYRDYRVPSDLRASLLLADVRDGREVDYSGEEGAKLLRILENLKPWDERLRPELEEFERILRKNKTKPNQSLQPTALLGRG